MVSISAKVLIIYLYKHLNTFFNNIVRKKFPKSKLELLKKSSGRGDDLLPLKLHPCKKFTKLTKLF